MECTGTFITNRFKGYSFTKDAQLRRGEYEVVNRGKKKICVVKCKDTMSVLMVSTCIGAQPVTNVQLPRWDKTIKRYINVPCPSNVRNGRSGCL